ncbi:DUF6701 domain-containing protein [Vibrio bivalvicida]|uniref:DUF6701 domain-containing protein n=1 Tax=Vibrio bivalvicida TaxID=1276888 RepID=A0A177Y1D5_9VIBR|nr:DUF6701 domain-containing protein [Vibrio bivalvicida]OAJ94684.1 hypothetical protein APB76_08620 [Vibrio bivalvicida]
MFKKLIRYLIWLLSSLALLFCSQSLAAALSCKVIGNDQDFVVEFDVIGSASYQDIVFSGGIESATLWYTQSEQAGSSYVFNEQRLAVGESYKLRIEVERGQGTSVSRAHYYWVSNGNKYLQESKDADIKNGTINGSGTGLDTLSCFAQNVEPPPPTPVLPDICPYFPAPIATNKYVDGKPFASQVALSGARNVIELSERKAMSFNSVSLSGSLSGCKYDGGNLESCLFDSELSYQNFPVQLPSFQSGTLNVVCDDGCDFSLQPGSYDTIQIGQNNSRIVLDSGEYWVDQLEFMSDDARLEVNGKVVLHYKQLNVNGDRVGLNRSGNSSDLVLIGHGNAAAISTGKNDLSVRASLYVDPVNGFGFTYQGARLDYQGAVIVPKIQSTNNDNIFKGQLPAGCGSPTVASLEIKPFNYHLTCETTPNNIVEVHMLDSNGDPVAGFSPTLVQENGSNLSITFISEENGVAKFRVTTNTASNVGDYDLKASLTTGGQTFTDTDQIKFVPYKFEVADQYVTAGQNNQVPVKVKACSNNGQLITLGYTGSPSAAFTYQRPTSAVVDAGDLSFTANLSDSNRQADYNFKESGQIRVTITDNSFVCDDVRCPVEGGALKGQFDIYARPWKVAICDVAETGGSNKANPATTTGSPGFLSGGTGFSATYKPIVHSDSKGGASDECSYPITGNYGLDNGELDLTYSVSYPATNPQMGTVTPSPIPNFNSSNLTQTINHTWTEVGTLQIQTSAEYLTMTLNADTQDVGRFYPDFFKIDENAWNDPLIGLGPQKQAFTYMNQTFSSVTAKVGAYNVQGSSTTNYGAFSNSLQAVFQFDHRDRLTNADVAALAAKSSYQSSQWVLESDQIVWNKNANFTPDGPYNYLSGNALNVSLEVLPSTVNDPVRFKSSAADTNPSSTQVLPDEQPRLLFGRYNLADVGGVQGESITVPLQTQYWNGSSFQTNTNDSFSDFDGMHYCSNVIWPSSGAIDGNVALSESGTISSGESRTLIARQTVSTREQVQLWLRLDTSSPSANCSGTNNGQTWMMYDWNQNGTDEENPSAVATFGIFRGNDRVIFRGESGLTGQ